MKNIEQWFRKNKITEVECIISDMTGNARGKTICVDKFMTEQTRLPECILLQTVTGHYCDEHDDFLSPEDQDMVLAADTNTARLIPWSSTTTAQVIHNCQTVDGQDHQLSSRNVLRHVLSQFESLGIKPVIAPEVEFYLVQQSDDPNQPLKSPLGESGKFESNRQSFGIDALHKFEPIIDTMREYCKTQQLDIETVIHESGAAQVELNFRHGDPLELADQVFTFKRTMRRAALKHGLHATFMAKPIASEPGSSMHIHQSLVDHKSGNNLFVKENGERSEMFMNYLGGLQQYTPNLISFYAPNVNSYRRLTKNINAPINMHWGYDNRTVGLRIPDAKAAATRIENRFSGIDANPYLAIAASLASGLAGIKNKLQPTEQITTSAYDEEITISRTLKEALNKLSDHDDVAKIIGADFINAYRYLKLNEFEEFNQVVTAWEREQLLLNV